MKKIIWLAIIALGIILRLIEFGRLPLSLNRDEAALGYNAFAIATEGIDEWGSRYPLMFKSFGDYKLPGYIYSLVPLIQLFGLSESITRLPSLLAGIAIIGLVYLLAIKIGFSKTPALAASAIIAVSPWAVFYSRTAFEANLASALWLAALIIFMGQISIAKTIAGSALFAAAIATYNTPLILTPVLIIIVAIKKSTPVKKIMQIIVISLTALLWTQLISPLIVQKSAITVFSDPTLEAQYAGERISAQSFTQRVIHHRFVFYAKEISSRAMESLSPNFLVFSGGANPWHSIPNSGHLLLSVYVLAVVGIFLLKFNRRSVFTILIIAAGLLPAIVTVDAPHATRSLFAFVGLTLLSASAIPRHKAASTLIGLVILVDASFYGFRYFVDFPNRHAPEWQVGLKPTLLQLKTTDTTAPIAIANYQNQPYIYTLYYHQTPPSKYLETVSRLPQDSAGIEYVRSWGNYIFLGLGEQPESGVVFVDQNANGEYQIKVQ